MPGGYCNIDAYNKSITQEQRKENCSRAGYKSAENQRKKRLMRDIISEMLLMDSFDPDVGAKLTALGLQPTNANALQLTAIAKAVSGDAEMLRFVRDTVGEKPSDALSVTLDKPIAEMDLSQLSTEELADLAKKVADAE